MKRFTAILLTALMLLSAGLCGCGLFVDTETKGAYINVYMGSELRSWDPAKSLNDASAVQYLSLCYESMMKYDENGKVVKGICDTYEYDEETNTLVFTLRKTAWSDGRRISADDFVYSWKRILNPDFSCDAKSLLYYIKNARALNEGTATLADVGLASIDTYTLEVTLEQGINYELFLENIASIALAPVREDYASVYEDTWDRSSTNIITSGAFTVKNMESGKEGQRLVLERNKYYNCINYDSISEEIRRDKYVKPFRLIFNFSLSEDDRTTAYNYRAKDGEVTLSDGKTTLSEAADQLHYISGSLASSNALASKAKTDSTLSTMSLFLNTKNALLAKQGVRQALSLALDREALASVYVGAKAATGLVPNGVSYGKVSSSFRKEAGDLLPANADLSAAKSALSSAGVSSGTLTLTYRDTSHNGEIAQSIKEAWEQLGLKIKLNPLDAAHFAHVCSIVEKGNEEYIDPTVYTTTEEVTTAEAVNGEDTVVTKAPMKELFNNGKQPEMYYNYDIVLLDYQTLTPSAFSTLAPFAVGFSGNAVATDYDDYAPRTHMTGYNSEEYNALIEQAFKANDRAEMSKILVDAEKLLLTDLPVIPLFQNANAYLASSAISGETKSINVYGAHSFTKVSQSKFDNYIPSEEKESQ